MGVKKPWTTRQWTSGWSAYFKGHKFDEDNNDHWKSGYEGAKSYDEKWRNRDSDRTGYLY